MRAQEQPAHVHDIHASMIWALGLDHVKTTTCTTAGPSARRLCGELIKGAVRVGATDLRLKPLFFPSTFSAVALV